MLKQNRQINKLKSLIIEIHKSPLKLNIILTGGGFSFLNWLLLCEGASNTVMKATIPYNRTTLFQIIGEVPTNNSLVSKHVSSKLATFAHQEFPDLKDDPHFFGISCSGSISTNYKKKGSHHAWVSINNGSLKRKTLDIHIKLEKGLRNRIEEDQIISNTIIKFVYLDLKSKTEMKDIDLSKIFDIKLYENEKIDIFKG